MNSDLKIQNINYWRAEQHLLKNINLQVQSGELIWVTGPNGSGKTTLLRLMSGLLPLEPDSGEILWNNCPIKQCRADYLKNLVYIGHGRNIKNDLTVEENLSITTALSGNTHATSITTALEKIGLSTYARALAKTLSTGQQRRLALAKLLTTDAPLWILDEPLAALDASGVMLITDLLATHVQHGGMVIVTTHQALHTKGTSNLSVKHVLLNENY